MNLLPCPFCGGKADYDDFRDNRVSCKNLNCDMLNVTMLSTLWNTRAACEGEKPNHIVDANKMVDWSPFEPPFRYDSDGSCIWDADNNMAVDIRGWGFLTGGGALKLSHANAVEIQLRIGTHLAALMNEGSILEALRTDGSSVYANMLYGHLAFPTHLKEAADRVKVLENEKEVLRERLEALAKKFDREAFQCYEAMEREKEAILVACAEELREAIGGQP